MSLHERPKARIELSASDSFFVLDEERVDAKDPSIGFEDRRRRLAELRLGVEVVYQANIGYVPKSLPAEEVS